MKANEQHGIFTGRGEVRLVRTLPGPIERVWEYLTDPEKRARWFAGGAIEPRAGGKVVLRFRHAAIAPDETPPADHAEFHHPGKEIHGRVTRWDPPRALGYTFDGEDSDVLFELAPEGKSVLLVVTHRARGDDIPFITGFAGGWHTHLTHLVALLQGDPRPPFWPVHARLKAEYKALYESLNLSLAPRGRDEDPERPMSWVRLHDQYENAG